MKLNLLPSSKSRCINIRMTDREQHPNLASSVIPEFSCPQLLDSLTIFCKEQIASKGDFCILGTRLSRNKKHPVSPRAEPGIMFEVSIHYENTRTSTHQYAKNSIQRISMLT